MFSIKLTKDECRLILSEASLSPELTQRLRAATVEGDSAYVHFTLDNLDELAEAVAAEANRCPNKSKQKQWDGLYGRIVALLKTRPDEHELPHDEGQPSPFRLLHPDVREEIQGVLKNEQFENLDDLNARIAQIMSEYNRRPQEEMGGLSPEQVAYLIYSEWEDPEGAVQLNENLPLHDVQNSELLVNARMFLAAVSEAGRIEATAAGNLNRKFVGQMLDVFVMEEDIREEMYEWNKVINEDDVGSLHLLRVVLELARLVKHSKGFFTLTRKASNFLAEEEAGALFALLFRTHFRKFNLAYRDYLIDNPGLQMTVAYSLFMLSKHASDWIKPEALPPLILLPKVREIDVSDTLIDILENQVETRIIRPLESFGLLEKRYMASDSKYFRRYEIRKTPLYDKFVRFRLHRDVLLH